MTFRSHFTVFAGAIATALLFLPAQAATKFEPRLDPAMTLSQLTLEAQTHAVHLVGP